MENTFYPSVNIDPAAIEKIRSDVKGTAGWLKFLGVLTLIGGILTALGLVGILYIILGIIMMNAANRGKDFSERGDTSGLVEYNSKLKTLFTIYGVLAIIGLVAAAIWIIVMIIILAVGGLGALQGL